MGVEGDFRVESHVLGAVGTNCYIVYHNATKRAVIIDPADDPDFIIRTCTGLEVVPEAVLLTHGHADHMLAAEKVAENYRIPVIAGEKEKTLLEDPGMNLSLMIGGRQVSLQPQKLVKDKEIIRQIGFDFQVMETPGHTEGSVCFYIKEAGVLFAGDTLFEESFGRTDFPTGSMSNLFRSITEKLFALPEDTMVYSGHGAPTSVGHEKKYNPIYYYGR